MKKIIILIVVIIVAAIVGYTAGNFLITGLF